MAKKDNPIPKVVYLNESKFRDSMLKMRRRGGAHQRAFEKACELITSLGFGLEELNKLTKHGESRINHCLKYQISNDAHRLVTVQTDGFIYLLHVGAHEDVDRWLNHNRGLTITANAETNAIRVTHVTQPETDGPRESTGQNFSTITEENLPYLKRLPDFDAREFVSQNFLVKQLEALNESSTDSDIEELTAHIAEIDQEIGAFLFDVILELRQGNLSAAIGRVDQFRGEAKDITTDPDLESGAIGDRINSDKAILLGDLTEEEIKKLFEPDKFDEWMLFPHPDQKRIARKDYEKPTVLTGVSGSGKTCVLVHRARYLAQKYPDERILVLTLSRSLSKLIQNLLESLCSGKERKNIRVQAFYDYFAQLVRHFGPDAYLAQLKQHATHHPEGEHITRTMEGVDPSTYAREFDPVGKETLDDTWNIFLEQPFVRTLVAKLTDRVRSYDEFVNVEDYLREELSLVRSGVPTGNRKRDYSTFERDGRSIRFDQKSRRLVLDLLLLYEETMLSGGMLDELSLTLTVLPHLQQLSSLPDDLTFRCLLIDEFQDFSTRDLVLLRRATPPEPNALFVTGDTVQRILVKDLRLGAAGLDIINSTWERIKKNYRNSMQILRAAGKLANTYGEKAKAQGVEIEILDPELAVRETAKPMAIQVRPEDEIDAAYRLAKDCLISDSTIPWAVCIATACPDVITVDKLLKSQPDDFPVKVDKLTGDYTRNKDSMTVGTISDVKGFEFSMIIIVGCGQRHIPPSGCCVDETWRHALRLYVAMTRGRDQVALIYSGAPSEFLDVMRPDLEWGSPWEEDAS